VYRVRLQGLSLVAIVGRVGIPMERAGWGRVGNMGDLDLGRLWFGASWLKTAGSCF